MYPVPNGFLVASAMIDGASSQHASIPTITVVVSTTVVTGSVLDTYKTQLLITELERVTTTVILHLLQVPGRSVSHRHEFSTYI